MRPRKDIENLIKEFDIDVNPKKDRRILDELRKLQTRTKKSSLGTTVIDIWRIIMQSKITKYAMAAIIVVAVLFGINQFGVQIDGAAPAFASVMKNVLNRKWVYMFEEDRQSGTIRAEYWYSPKERKLFGKRKKSIYAFAVDLTTKQMTEYRGGNIVISDSYELEDADSTLNEILSMIKGKLDRFKQKGAVITQKSATYNQKPVHLYEIEMTFPEGYWMRDVKRYRTYQYIWIIDKKTQLPIICEYKSFLFNEPKNDTPKFLAGSRRYAFDFSESGPADIYDLGVPKDASVIDERPEPKLQAIYDKIDKIKKEYYRSYAAIIMERGLPRNLLLQDGKNIREERYELKVNYSDFEEKKEQYAREMGDSFDNMHQWISNNSEILSRSHVYMTDGVLGYSGSRIEPDPPVLRKFFSYCWCYVAKDRIVKDEYSKENELVCISTNNGHKYYYDPAKNYFCVRYVDAKGNIRWEITEIGVTDGGMIYPKTIRQAYHQYNEDKTKLTLTGYTTYRIYVTDLNDSFKPLLDSHSFPGYVDHRKLTQKYIEKRQAAVDPNAPPSIEYTGFTPLHMAIFRKDIDKVKKYLRKGADVEPNSDTGASPMELAIETGSLEMIKLLHKNGADFTSNDKEKRSCLGLAVRNGSHDIVKYMLALKNHPNAAYRYKTTPLHYAAANGDVEMLKMLLLYGANTDTADLQGYTPLGIAVERYAGKTHNSKPMSKEQIKNYQQSIRLLIDKGSDINSVIDYHCKTTILVRALQLIVDRGHADQQIELLKFLLDIGANPNLMTDNASPLDVAVKESRYDIIKTLLDNGADPWRLPYGTLAFNNKSHLLRTAKLQKQKKLYELLWPYMKDRFEATNKALEESSKLLMKAVMSNDSDAIKEMCLDHPHYGATWNYWAKEIRKTYTGNEELIEKIVIGAFTVDNFASVYVPMPKGSKDKSVLLGFFLHPDGKWRCVFYKKYSFMPKVEHVNLDFYGHSFEEFLNLIYEQEGMTDKLSIGGSRKGTCHGDYMRGTIDFKADGNNLHINRADKRWYVLTEKYVKEYGANELEICKEYLVDQKDGKMELAFKPGKFTIIREGRKYVFTVKDGKVVLDDGKDVVTADKIVVKMPEVVIEPVESESP